MTRAQLTARAAAFFAERYPIAFTSAETALMLGIPERTARRVVADLLGERVIEPFYSAYRLHTRTVDSILDQKSFAQKDKEKDLWKAKTKKI